MHSTIVIYSVLFCYQTCNQPVQ